MWQRASGSGNSGGWGQQEDMSSSAAAGYRGRGEDRGSWGTTPWSGERGGDGDEGVAWTAAEQDRLRKSVKENGLDDWTLGDWSEVRRTDRRRPSLLV